MAVSPDEMRGGQDGTGEARGEGDEVQHGEVQARVMDFELHFAVTVTGENRPFPNCKREPPKRETEEERKKNGRRKEEGTQQDIAGDCMYTMYTTCTT